MSIDYSNIREVESRSVTGVSFRVYRVSFGRRIEFTRRVRELGRRIEFHEAGEQPEDRIEAAISAAEIERLYLEWGVAGLDGLRINGREADVQLLIDDGPEELCHEIAAEVRRELGLTGDEPKN